MKSMFVLFQLSLFLKSNEQNLVLAQIRAQRTTGGKPLHEPLLKRRRKEYETMSMRSTCNVIIQINTLHTIIGARSHG